MHWTTPGQAYWSAMSQPKEQVPGCSDCDCRLCGCDCHPQGSDLAVVFAGIVIGVAFVSLLWVLAELT